MQFMMLIYNDDRLLEALPEGEFDARMAGCFAHADDLKAQGRLLGSQQLESFRKARTLRVRNGKQEIVDGPFAETKEVLAGYNIIEAADMDEAMAIASAFPWAKTGAIELRPIRDMDAVRTRVGG
jgi:hypothetical protein